MRNRCMQSGFTLTELIMVIVILGVLSAVAMPIWFSKSDFDERGYFDELIQAARYAQKYAVASNCNVAFLVTANNFSLSIQPTTNHPHCGSAAIPLSLPAKNQTSYTAPSGVSVTGAFSTNFLPSGAASVGGQMQIGNHRLQIHPSTGYVERL